MTYSSEVLADSPVGYWRLGETSGTTAVDSSGNGYDGTYTGTYSLNQGSLLWGDSDPSFYAQGAGWVEITHNSALNPTSAITIEAWHLGNVSGGDWGASEEQKGLVTMRRDTTGSGSPLYNYSLQVGYPNAGATDYHHVGFRLNIGGTEYSLRSIRQIGHRAIYYLVGTYDGSTMKLYIDGVLDNTLSVSGSISTGSSNSKLYLAHVGPLLGSVGTKGNTDECAVYNTALSAARILVHFEAGAPHSSTPATPTDAYGVQVVADGPVAFWRFADDRATAMDTVGSHEGIYKGPHSQQPSLECANYDILHSLAIGSTSGPVPGYITMPHSSDLAMTTGLTLEGWVWPQAFPPANMIPIGKETVPNGGVHDYRMQIDSDIAYFVTRVGGVTKTLAGTTNSVPNNGPPTHIVMTYDGADMKIYINGVINATMAVTGNIDNSSGRLIIGKGFENSYANGFYQYIQDFAVYNYALSAAQALDHYLIGTTMATPVALPATGVTTTGFTANWSAYPYASHYYLYVALDAGFTTPVSGYNPQDLSGSTLSSTLTGLTTGVTYYYRIAVKTEQGPVHCISPYSNTISVVPGAVQYAPRSYAYIIG